LSRTERSGGLILSTKKTVKKTLIKTSLFIFIASVVTFADNLYVNANSASPAAPYSSWETAATVIQDAVDVASIGDEIIVTNGIYNSGGKPAAGSFLTNRVCVEIDILLKSVNGPQSTIIVGSGPFGSNAVRGVCLLEGTLSGFTVSNGYTFNSNQSFPYRENSGGGVYAYSRGVITNCVISENNARLGGGVSYGDVFDSVLKQNFATREGGGTWHVDLFDSLICDNFIDFSMGHGGGLRYGNAYRCNIVSNKATYGAGVHSTYLYNCLLARNVGSYGGGAQGAYYNIMENCTIVENVATNSTGYGRAGGVYGYKISNSIIYNNFSDRDTNTYNTTNSYNCTFPMPPGEGNITNNPEFVNLLAGDYRISSSSPCINSGENSLAASNPDFARNLRIIDGIVDMGAYEYLLAAIEITNQYANVPSGTTSATIGGTNNPYCVGGFSWTNISAGTSGSVIRSNDSNSWTALIDNLIIINNEVFIYGTNVDGVITYDSMIITRGGIAVGSPFIDITNSSMAVDFSVESFAVAGTNNENIIGEMRIESASEFTTTNIEFAASTSWIAPTVNLEFGPNILKVFGTNSLGHITNDTITITRSSVDPGVSPVHYVSPLGGNVWPYTNWISAATNIQTAINTATPGDMILVTNGIYNSGKYVEDESSSRILITNDVIVKSVNGHENTFIVGEGFTGGGLENTRCTKMTQGTLVGFTLSNGWARFSGGDSFKDRSGGGVLANSAAVISNCVIVKCSASQNGGGGYKGIYFNCLITENYVGAYGGGGSGGEYYNCTIVDNSSVNWGDGISGSFGDANLYNCIIYNNDNENYNGTVNLNYCCTFPLPASGSGNITNSPEFVSSIDKNYRLQSTSLCIDKGDNSFAPLPFDLDGNTRIFGGIVDMGCYEFQGGIITITNAPDIIIYQAASNNVWISGTNTVVDGDMSWINSRASETTNFFARSGNSWDAYVTNLMIGANEITILATNRFEESAGVRHTIEVGIYTNFVSLLGAHITPFENFQNAATNIQDAVDLVFSGGSVIVTDGVYNIGARITPGYALSNRVLISKNIILKSVNGAENTFIEGEESAGGGMGDGAVRAVYMTAGTFKGFTIQNGYTLISGNNFLEQGGGGIFVSSGCIVEDCVFTNNYANKRGGGALCYNGGKINRCKFFKNYSGGGGGGVYCLNSGTVMNCLMTDNTVANNGGGVFCYNGGVVINSTICNNYAGQRGGGIRTTDAAVTNSIIYYNSAGIEGDNWNDTLNPRYAFCCSVPILAGNGNITNSPKFIDAFNNNFRLQFGSDCINTGTNLPWMVSGTDLDGSPRIHLGVVDMGAYEAIPEPFLFINCFLLFIICYLRSP